MKDPVLGILCSPRKYGNNEILLKQFLTGVTETGSKTSILRLTDFNIRQCQGCLQCVFGKKGCVHDDDMLFLLSTINQYKAFVIASPIYFFGVPGAVKTFLDRLVMLYRYSRRIEEWEQGKIAVLMTVGGVSGWDAFALPTLSSLALVLGGSIKANYQFLQYPGPGEILSDNKVMSRIKSAGKHIWDSEFDYNADHCPVCRHSLYHIRGHMEEVVCPLCNTHGKLSDGMIIWPEVSRYPHRWTHNALFDFVDTWIISSRDRYIEASRSTRKQKRQFLDNHHSWNWIKK
jgi:multimeric flavodoxin WrbA